MEKAHDPMRLLCRCLAVSRSGFYAWQTRGPSVRVQQDRHLTRRLRLVHAQLWTTAGWWSLAVGLDLGSRRLVGWAIRESLGADLVLAALHVALGARPAPPLHHSDRGSQYASHQYRALLDARGITVSMSRVGNCGDHAPVASFFSSLNAELVSSAAWRTASEGTTAVAEYLRFYNHTRSPSALGYRSPAPYEVSFVVAV